MLRQTHRMDRGRLAKESVVVSRKDTLEARRERLSRRFAAGTPSGTPQLLLTHIEVGPASRPFFFIKLANVFILTLGIQLGAGVVANAVMDPEFQLSELLLFSAIYVGPLAFACVMAWRNLGVLDSVVRRFTTTSLVLLALAGCVMLGVLVVNVVSGEIDWRDRDGMFQAIGAVYIYGGSALLALACVFAVGWGRRGRMSGLDLRIGDLLRALKSEGAGQRPFQPVSPANAGRAAAFLALGLGWILAIKSIPYQVFYDWGLHHIVGYIEGAGYVLLLYARFYLQPDARVLLAADKRPPVLFLRSFIDDEKFDSKHSKTALFDFSLEARLATHFGAIGPFIAVGSPKDSTPRLGASRVRLDDGEWRQAVLGWMDSACYLIVFAGLTHWAKWELCQAIERGYANKLILLFPEIRFSRIAQFLFSEVSITGRRREMATERLDAIRQVLAGTIWQEALSAITVKPEQIRSLVLQPRGRIAVITSTTRSRNSYHLAALVSQFLLSERTDTRVVVATSGRDGSALPPRFHSLTAA
jgi:hypothetical protein